MTLATLVLAAVLPPSASAALVSTALDAAGYEKILGRPVAASNGEFKVSAPRTDLDARVDGWRIVPAMGLTAWIGFAPHGDRCSWATSC